MCTMLLFVKSKGWRVWTHTRFASVVLYTQSTSRNIPDLIYTGYLRSWENWWLEKNEKGFSSSKNLNFVPHEMYLKKHNASNICARLATLEARGEHLNLN